MFSNETGGREKIIKLDLCKSLFAKTDTRYNNNIVSMLLQEYGCVCVCICVCVPFPVVIAYSDSPDMV